MNKVTERAILDSICDDVLPAYGIASDLGRNDPELADGVRSALASAPVAVKVKKLIWSEYDAGWWEAKAEDILLGYEVRVTDRGAVRVRFPGMSWESFDGSEEAAKAAAQADYERRILSAIEPQEGRRMSGRDIYEVANQLEGYVDGSTPERLAKFLLREGAEASKLADTISTLTARVAELEAALRNLANEMRHMLRANPSKDGGLYRLRLTEAEDALAGHAPAEGDAKVELWGWANKHGAVTRYHPDKWRAIGHELTPLYTHPPAQEPKP